MLVNTYTKKKLKKKFKAKEDEINELRRKIEEIQLQMLIPGISANSTELENTIASHNDIECDSDCSFAYTSSTFANTRCPLDANDVSQDVNVENKVKSILFNAFNALPSTSDVPPHSASIIKAADAIQIAVNEAIQNAVTNTYRFTDV